MTLLVICITATTSHPYPSDVQRVPGAAVVFSGH
jgi:hypothetical protein